MPRKSMRNMHVPLPHSLYERLKAQAERARRPATELVREAIDRWLTERHRAAIHEEISRYANAVAGTNDDLDPALESAGVEHILAARKMPKRSRG